MQREADSTGAEKDWGILYMCKYLTGSQKQYRARLLVVLSDRKRGKSTNLGHQKHHLRKSYTHTPLPKCKKPSFTVRVKQHWP